MSHIILEATLHEEHNGAGQGQEVKHAERAKSTSQRLLSHGTALPPGCCSMLGTRDANRDQIWQYRSVTLVPGLLRKQDYHELETSLGYMG